jgi:hypothetical protein
MPNLTDKTDRRIAHDRREKPTDLMSKCALIGGRRRNARRKEDRIKYMVVDFYSSRLWITLLSIMVLTLVDAYLTILLIDMGIVKEVNPIMAFYLSYGPRSFVAMKVVFTAVPLFFFCLCKDFSITKISVASSIMIYLSIVIYELAIIYRFHSHADF